MDRLAGSAVVAAFALAAAALSADSYAQKADTQKKMSFFVTSAGSAQVGHHDRQGLNDKPPAKSWNHSHPSRGCSQDNLRSSGGNGFFYCFAAK